jgi:8-oxo-dGTP pyrophosphatase MutT (NUDIX family)
MAETPDWMKPQGRPWTWSGERTVYDNPWITLREYPATAPTGHPATYAVIGFKNYAIGVLPLHADGTVTLVGQNRFPMHGYSWEIPEGGGPLDHDPLDSAKRELQEETGLVAAEWLPVLRYELSNSVTDERGFGFIALGLTQAEAAPDETEVIHLARRPFREALDLALSGAMPDMITIAMLLRAYHMAREGLLPAELAKAMLS